VPVAAASIEFTVRATFRLNFFVRVDTLRRSPPPLVPCSLAAEELRLNTSGMCRPMTHVCVRHGRTDLRRSLIKPLHQRAEMWVP